MAVKLSHPPATAAEAAAETQLEGELLSARQSPGYFPVPVKLDDEKIEAILWAWRLEAFHIAARAAAGQAPPRGNTTEWLCADAHRIFSEITGRQWNGQLLSSPLS